MTDRVGWGVLGCGWITSELMGPAIAASRSGRLVAVASRDRDVAEKAARKLGAARAYAPYDALLDDAEVDAVYVALPNGLHEAWATRCAEAGKHVLCEKSLTMTTTSARRMAGALASRDLLLVEAFMYRHHPQWRALRDALPSIGRVRAIRASFSHPFQRLEDHRFSRALGGGALWDLTTYGVNAARLVLGAEPSRVAAMAEPDPRDGVDLATQALMSFPGDALASVYGLLRAADEQRLVVVGELGTIEVPRPFVPGSNEAELLVARDGETRRLAVGGANHFALQVEHFAARVLHRGADAWPAEDGVANVAACEAIERSWRSGEVVTLPLPIDG